MRILRFYFFLILLGSMQAMSVFSASEDDALKNAMALYSEGKYQSTITELTDVEEKLKDKMDRQRLGLISYWRGICHNRLQNFSEAIKNFDRALGYEYSPQDIHYEYGQALYASEKLAEARIQFKESLKKKFKRGVSLYYIGFLSKELGEANKAYTFFRAVEKLGDEEKADVFQASQMQLGDLYLEQAEKGAEAFKMVESVVIPQYEKARDLNPESPLGNMLSDKIQKLQVKYELVLFQLRNGRPTLNPPHFLRAAQELGYDTNVTFSPAETTVSKAKQGSLYSKTDFIGRYTYYIKDYVGVSPELRFNNTYYFNRVPEIYRNDNYLIAPALRTSYEHTLWKKPASVLLDYDFSESKRDVEANKKLIFSSRTHTLMLGERFNYFKAGESIVRLRHRNLTSYLSSSNSKTTSLVFEQVKTFSIHTLLLMMSYDLFRVEDSNLDTDSFSFRGDFIMARFRDWFTPSFSLAVTSTTPINNSSRGRELLLNPSIRLSKTFKKAWRANARYDFQNYSSKDKDNFAYQKQLLALEVEYLF